jgi:hypothetical protein
MLITRSLLCIGETFQGIINPKYKKQAVCRIVKEASQRGDFSTALKVVDLLEQGLFKDIVYQDILCEQIRQREFLGIPHVLEKIQDKQLIGETCKMAVPYLTSHEIFALELARGL